MDFSILKSIVNPPYYVFPTQRKFNLPSNPHIDYINPGIGFVTKKYDFYIPIHGNRLKQHSIVKKDNETFTIDEKNAELQEGKGEVDSNNITEKLDNNDISSHVLPQLNTNQSKKRMNNEIFEAFMHPKIKVAKLTFDKKTTENLTGKGLTTQKTLNKNKKEQSHRFNIV